MNDDVSTATADPTVDGRRSRWDAHRVARREELIDAAVRAVSRYGAGVGMDQIAAVAQTSKPVVYRYFTDKNELYRAVSQRVVGHVLDTLRAAMTGQPPAREVIHASVDAYLALLEQQPELYRFVVAHHPHGEADFAREVAELLAERLAAHLAGGGLDPSLAHPWAEAIVGFIDAASLWWLDHPGAMTREQLGDYLSALLWSGAAGAASLPAH